MEEETLCPELYPIIISSSTLEKEKKEALVGHANLACGFSNNKELVHWPVAQGCSQVPRAEGQ